MEKIAIKILENIGDLIAKTNNSFFSAEWRERIQAGIKEDNFYHDLADYLKFNCSTYQEIIKTAPILVESIETAKKESEILKDGLYKYFINKFYAYSIDNPNATIDERKTLTKMILSVYNLGYMETEDNHYKFFVK